MGLDPTLTGLWMRKGFIINLLLTFTLRINIAKWIIFNHRITIYFLLLIISPEHRSNQS